MDFNPGQKNTNGSQPQHAPAPRFPSNGGGAGGLNMGGDGNKKTLMVVVGVVALLVLAVLAWMMWGSKMGGSAGELKGDRYQAVFLTNGQVYFCKLTNVDDSYVKCNDIYYLQVQQTVQPDQNKDNQPQVSLAKLGSELHGPEDAMYINRDQVLFWENLKNDGKVVQAIQNNQKK